MPSSPEVIDVEGLLSPVAGENPAGENLQYSGLHDQIREARRAEDDLAQGDWQREVKVADWDEVIRLATQGISKSKDLQICAWLAEAEVRKNGFPGLRDGLKLARGLQERFWEKLYPEVDSGDLEARANTLSLLDKQCAKALKEVAITKASGTSYSFLDMETAKLLDLPANAASLDSETMQRLSQERARAAEEGKVTSEGFTKSRGATRRVFYEETFAVLNECWEEFGALDRVMDEKFGRQTPGLSGLKKSLDLVRSWVEKTVKEKRIEEPDASDAGEVGADGEPGVPGAAGGAVRTRQDALRRLAEVADYFRRTEPHSPVAYLVQRAITWGHMPLDAWLGDVIKDSNLLESLRETLGLKTTSESG